MMDGFKVGTIIVEQVNGGYIIRHMAVSSPMSALDIYVAKNGDGGEDLMKVIRTLLVTDQVSR